MATEQHVNAADRRTSVTEAFNTENKYWGARFCDNSKVTPWKLLWHTAKKVKQYTTTLRIFPGKNPAHHVDWDPYRLSQGRDDFGDWIRWHWAWRRAGFGDPITFLLHPQKELDMQSPVALLHRSIKYAVDHGKGDRSGWGAMIGDKSDRGAIIGRPKRMFMVQAAIFEHGGKWFDIPKGLDEEDLPVLVDIGSDAAKSVIRLCRERWKPEELTEMGFSPQHWMDWYKYGDPVALDQGRFFEFYPEAAPPPHILAQQRANRPLAPTGPLRLSPQALRERRRRDDHDRDDDDGRAIEGYTVNCYEQVGPDEINQSGPELTLFEEQLYERVRPWSDVLLFPTYKQQAEMIVPLLRLSSDSNPRGELRLDVLEPAWGDHKDWWPDESSDVWAEWVGRVSVSVPEAPVTRPAARAGGPGFTRRPPSANGGPPGREDETLAGRTTAGDAAEADADAPPPRPQPRHFRPAADPAVPEPADDTPTARPVGGVDVADHFARIAAEEAALKARGIRPDFPTPDGGQEQTPNWRDRLAARRGQAETAPPDADPAPAPAPAPAPTPPFDRAENGGGFTPPPAGHISVADRLAQMRNATKRIPQS